MKKQQTISPRNLVALVLSILMVLVMIPDYEMTAKADSTTALSNPRILDDESMGAKQKTTYDCIWFGSYPQTEVVAKESDCITYGAEYQEASDFIEDSTLYNRLAAATEWDSNNDITLDGTKYRRETIKKTFHYFRFEPIKWRVLNQDGNKAFLMADIALDYKCYQDDDSSLKINTWEKSWIRSWLNGYDGSSNLKNIDCSTANFIDTAFSTEEQNAVINTELDNSLSLYSGYYDSNDTTDKVFLLSFDDISVTDQSKTYGFNQTPYTTIPDEARQCKSSTYAKKWGLKVNSTGKVDWSLRSSGRADLSIVYVSQSGTFVTYTYDYYQYYGVRPALNLDLSNASWDYAGTVCTDGTVVEDASQITHTHTWDSIEAVTATCITKGLVKHKCSGCEEYILEKDVLDPDNHTPVTETGYDSNCTETGLTDKITCSACGKVLQESEIIPAKGHQEVIDIAAIPATCTSIGYTAASHCGRSGCGITMSVREAIPSLGHKETAINEKPATLKEDGNTDGSYCANCGEIYEESEVIPRISKVSLSYTTATYSGKAKTPTVKVTDREGTVLKENTDYIVSKSSGRKNVGTYTYKITFFGKYDGTKKLTLTINPKGTTISKLTALTKSFKVTWKKNAAQTSGYQLQYSTSSTFKNAKTVTVSGTKTTAKTIKSLKAKTKYYVRIRTYKTVSGKKYYSAWSAKKSVKTK